MDTVNIYQHSHINCNKVYNSFLQNVDCDCISIFNYETLHKQYVDDMSDSSGPGYINII
jgi:hypothetical protein